MAPRAGKTGRTESRRDAPRLGGKVRALRRQAGLSQTALAEKLGISPSYLNFIESDRRPLTAPLLIALAQHFQIDVAQFAASDEARTLSELMEVFGDPLFESQGLTNTDVRELASGSPSVARAVVGLYQAYRSTKESVASLAARLESEGTTTDEGMGPLRAPSEEVSDLLQRQRNHFPALEEAAESLWRRAHLDADDLGRGLTWHLRRELGVELQIVTLAENEGAVRRYDRAARVLRLAEVLAPRSRNFALAHQIALLEHGEELEVLLDADGQITALPSRALARVALANYFAGAVVMPYARFLSAAQAVRYDIELLGHRFRTSFEQVCHRLTTMQRPGAEGVPFHLVRIDVAGNISKRFSASGIQFARYAGACPRWNVFSSFLTPGMIQVQLSKMPDGKGYFCLARTLRRESGGWHAPQAIQALGLGCRVEHAKQLVYADGIDLESESATVPVGVTCRLCERMDCAQRAFPPVTHPLAISEDVRGLSFYAPAR